MKIKSKQLPKVNPSLRLAFLGLSIFFTLFSILFLINKFTMPSVSKANSDELTSESRKQLVFQKDSVYETKSFQDSRPLISPDGKQLFFGRRNHPKNIGGVNDFQDIWVANLDTTGNLVKIRSLGTIINNSKGNGICSISPNGKEIILTNEYSRSGLHPICRSKNINGIWSKPEPIYIANYYNKSQYEDFYLSFQEKVLFIAVERKDGQGDQDLYVCFPDEEGNWKTPVNLGATVNTNAAEFAPYLGADGKTLFFTSYRPGGLGGSDIYATTRLDETWTNWSEPINLGPKVNTGNDENYFSISSDFKTIFVESYGKSDSTRNIFQVPLPSEFIPGTENFIVSTK